MRLLAIALLGWVAMPLGVALASLAMLLDRQDIHKASATLVFPIGPIASVVWAVGVSAILLRAVMHLVWSLDRRDTGPWSPWHIHVYFLLAMTTAQILIGAIVALMCCIVFPQWSPIGS
jgi:hypothetical protein